MNTPGQSKPWGPNVDRGQDVESDVRWAPMRCPKCGRTTFGPVIGMTCHFHHPSVALEECRYRDVRKP